MRHLTLTSRLLFSQKITKDNVWGVTVIDNFLNLLNKHHKEMSSFQVVGSSLEASTKVYVLRVDSLHYETLKMAQGLSRHTARAMNRDADDQDDSFGDDGDKENESQNQEGGSQKQPGEKNKRKKKRRAVATVTKNKDTLNEPLDTNPFTDPFFAQLNSIVGDINSSNRLMQNLLPSRDGELLLDMHYPTWDPSNMGPMVYNEDDTYENDRIVELTSPEIVQSDVLHHTLKGYAITDTPAEDDTPDGDNDISARSLNASGSNQAAMVFDPEAEVEPVHEGNDMIIDMGADGCGGFDDPDDDFVEQLSVDEVAAIQGCRGLKRQPVVLEDMRPVDNQSSHLEYSYRPLELISQFWAGPSHWKYRRLRSSVKKSLLPEQGADGTATTAGDASAKVAQKKRASKKKQFEPHSVSAILNFETDAFVPRDSVKLQRNITYSKAFISRKWNTKKLKLPTNLELDHNMFNEFTTAPGIQMMSNEPDAEPEIPADGYNYENVQDKEYCSQHNVGISLGVSLV